MDIQELKLGNLIKISPRENEEGVLFIIDIQHSSIIGEMLSPRKGYHFRIKYNDIQALEVSDYWLRCLGFSKDSEDNDTWTDPKNFVHFKLSSKFIGLIGDGGHVVAIDSISQLQNVYFELTGEKLSIVD